MARQIVYIDDLDEHGVLKDVKANKLPLNAWSDAKNMVFRDGHVQRSLGESAQMGTPTISPYGVFPWQDSAQYLWFYADGTAIYSTDGSTHTDRTRASGAYTSATTPRWNGFVHGGVPIFNNEGQTEPPQSWDPGSGLFVDMPNFPSAWKTKLLRPFGVFLLALNMTKSGTDYTDLLHWSVEADALAVPTDWTPAATNSAGSKVFSETTGSLIDCMTLGTNNIVYKEDSVYSMRYIGGNDVFGFVKIFNEFGLLTSNCVKSFRKKHLIVDAADVLVHDGSQASSIMDKRIRRDFFNAIDLNFYESIFILPNYAESEMWICIPELGSLGLCTKAYVWNWRNNTWTIRDLPSIATGHAGLVGNLSGYTWDDLTDTWDNWNYTWDERQYKNNARELLLAVPGTPAFLQADTGNQFSGVNFRAYVERTSLPLGGQNTKGELVVNEQNWIKITELWCQITGTSGDVVTIYVGTQDSVNDAVTWGAAESWIIGTTNFIPMLRTGRLVSIRFESTTDANWEVQRYGFNMKAVGNI